MQQEATQQSSISERFTDPGRRWLCPAGCPTNHGGPRAAAHLTEDWNEIPSEYRPPWSEFVAFHGRPSLESDPAPTPGLEG